MTKVSCPGKVLIAGGYLVLDRRFSGLSIALNQRFQVDVKSNFSAVLDDKILFRIKSLQFLEGNAEFEFVNDLMSQTTGTRNKFIETICSFCLTIAADQLKDNEFEICIQGDNDFYSQSTSGEKMTAEKLRSLQKFNKISSTIQNVKKTGLGSSAALTGALSLALLLHFKVVNPQDGNTLSSTDLDLVHNMAQVCHSVAQGKIGSGFDISSACYGSHVYKRFSPSIIDPILRAESISKDLLCSIIKSKWDCVVEPFSLPPGFLIQLGDISTGSNTPKMVSKLLDWKAKNPVECEKSWGTISFCNERIKNSLERLNDLYTRDSDRYNAAFVTLSGLSPRLWNTCRNVDSAFSLLAVDLYVTFQEIRKEMKKMGSLAGVDIEPDSQTSLLDGCLSLPGVVFAGVPGGICYFNSSWWF